MIRQRSEPRRGRGDLALAVLLHLVHLLAVADFRAVLDHRHADPLLLDGRPPVYGTGCTGLITHADRLDDGRFNLVLRGLDKFTMLGEEDSAIGQLYRRALITPIDETIPAADRNPLKAARRKLEGLLVPLFEGTMASRLPQNMPDDDLINALAQYLDFDPLEKQALLERHGPLARCLSMVELLEMKALLKNSPSDAGMIH